MIRSRVAQIAVALVTGAAAFALAAPGAEAQFAITSLDTSLTAAGTDLAPSSTNVLEAGAHPDLHVTVRFGIKRDDQDEAVPDDNARDVDAALPRGLTVNPSVVSTCTQQQLAYGFDARCPTDSQVGVAKVRFASSPDQPQVLGLYNMEQPDGAPAQLAFNALKALVRLNAGVRTGGDYGLSARASDISQGIALVGADITLWGVPADPIHDEDRIEYSSGVSSKPASSSLARQALVNNPTSCGVATAFAATAFSWEDPTRLVSATDLTEPDGSPYEFAGCSRLPFQSTASVKPTTSAPDSPTGLDVSVGVGQSASPDVPASAHLRDLKLTLPPGMNINPAAAAGLGSCSSAQIGLSSSAAAACPDNAKIGSVSLTTPLLREPLDGGVYLAAQNDNPFGSLLALYLVVDDQGVRLKLPGRIAADPATGQLTASFDDNPQLPFSKLDVHLNSGPRAALTTPPTCGTQTASVDISPWSGGATQTRASSFAIDCSAGLGAFSPAFNAGTRQEVAGLASPLIVNVDRADGQPALNRLSLRLPTGLLARLRGVRRCASAQADAGTCDSFSRVGTATVGAGAGSAPYSLPGEVFLTGPYKGAPFGLAVRVRAAAGPLDLGTVVVRQALFIDPGDTHVDVVSDPLPTILQGIPIRLRTLDVNVDRPGFAVNPTSCASKRVRGNLGSVDGRTASLAVTFRAGGCGDLELTPRLNLALGGTGATLRDGGHPPLKAVLTQPASGQSNLARAEVKLPLSLALDPGNAQTLCEYAEGRKAVPECPRGSVVGRAGARTPLLGETLRGPVYFVKGQRVDAKTKRVIKTLPTLVVPLSGGGVHITLRARTSVSGGRLVTTFDPIPDAPVTRFDLALTGGGHGILVANSSVCRKARTLGIGIRGQSGALSRSAPALRASCR